MRKLLCSFKTGFTLSEVLVTLLIIGVIASMTIPGLKKSADEQSYVSGAQKAYSSFSGATKMIKLKNGHVVTWPLGNKTSVLNLYKAQMNVTEMPNISSTKYDLKYLNGTAYNPVGIFSPSTTYYTSDGMLWFLINSSADCSLGGSSSNLINNACVTMMVDVNGPKKPNMVGIDIFAFYVTKDAVYPYGAGLANGVVNSTCNNNSSTSSAGFGCSARILSEGKITW